MGTSLHEMVYVWFSQSVTFAPSQAGQRAIYGSQLGLDVEEGCTEPDVMVAKVEGPDTATAEYPSVVGYALGLCGAAATAVLFGTGRKAVYLFISSGNTFWPLAS